MSLTKLMLDSFDYMDEEEYYFYQQQQMNEEWQWYEHSKKINSEVQESSNEN